MTNVAKLLRAEFPILARKTYLNSGSYGALALSVQAAVEAYLETRRELGADWNAWIGKLESLRDQLALLFNADADEIALTTSASASLNSLASAFDFSRGRRKIVVSDFEFPTNAQIWHAQAKRGAEIVHVATDRDGYIPVERFEQVIDAQTQLVAITHVCYRNGAKLDIGAIARIAHARGALILVDAYQSVGSEQIDVRALDLDFMVGGMLKYLLGTAGVGYLYVRKSLIPALVPTDSGWFAQEDIGAMDIGANRPANSARRFETGTPNVAGLYACEAGLALIARVGLSQIETRVRALTARCFDELEKAGCKLATPRAANRRGPTLAIRSTNDNALVAELLKRDIVTSCRDGNVRAAFHFYNDERDIDTLVDALTDLRPLLA